jgi:hypothetical protein
MVFKSSAFRGSTSAINTKALICVFVACVSLREECENTPALFVDVLMY